MEYPVAFLSRQSGGIDTQCTYHTFQLFHCTIFQCRLERTEQWCYLIVCFQYLKDGLVAFIQEGKDMGHIAVLTQPIGRFHFVPHFVEYSSCGYHTQCLFVLHLFCYQHVTVLVVWFFLPITEEVDTCRQEVHC